MHPEVTEYVILDDSSDMLDSQLERFVHIQDPNGFGVKDLCKCLRLFGKPDLDMEKLVGFYEEDKHNEL